MPQITAPDGSTQVIPGVYIDNEVRSSLPGAFPDFLVPVILGEAEEGIPYNIASIKVVEEEGENPNPFQLLKTEGAVAKAYGRGSEIHRASVFSKRHGLPLGYFCALNALTRASIDATSTGPVTEINLTARKAGYPSNWIKVAFDSAGPTLTLTPLRNYTRIKANVASADKRIVVQDNEWIKVGQTVYLGSNSVNSYAAVVTEKGSAKDANGQLERFIILSSGATAITTADYALVFEWDTQNPEVITPTSGTVDGLVQAINDNSVLLYATKDGSSSDTLPDDISTAKALREITEWASPTEGTSPALASSDSQAFVTYMNAGGWARFCLLFNVLPQAYLVVSSAIGVHEDFRDYALAERQRGYPISVTVGVAWGDMLNDGEDLTNYIDVRSAAIDSQDVCLCAGGLDYEAAYISLAAAVFGRRIEGGVNHNLTFDRLVFSSLEVDWDEINSGELTRIHRAGVITYSLNTATLQYVISQGLNTVQNNAGTVWDEATARTWSIQQRDIVDFNDRYMGDGLRQSEVGGDATTQQSIAIVLVRRAKALVKRGTMQADTHRITSITVNEIGAGWNVEQSYKPPTLSDYIGLKNTIVIGD